MKYILLAQFLFLTSFIFTQAADLVIFSYDRPMQLYALLESCQKYATGITSATVIYRSSSADFQTGYDIVQQEFNKVNFVRQNNPPHDFRGLVQAAVYEQGCSKYILFAVDDLIVKDYFDLNHCVNLIEQYNAYCFSLRLGKNINYCYMLNQFTGVPKLKQVLPEVFQYTFRGNKGDWCYPNNVDMTIYRKKDALEIFMLNNWQNPNQLEGCWAGYANLNQTSLLFDSSKVVNIPLNLVNLSNNRFMHSYSTAELLNYFLTGNKIDISQIASLKNNGVHIDFDISFIFRTNQVSILSKNGFRS